MDAQQSSPNPSNMLAPSDAAAYLGVAPDTLAGWRCRKRYDLPYVKVGNKVRYRKSDLDAFLASRTVGIADGARSPGSS